MAFTILYCIGSLSTKGGTERVLSTITKFFVEQEGMNIHIATNDICEQTAYKFSSSIMIHSMGDTVSLPCIRIPIVTNWIYKKLFYKQYEKLMQEISPDLVIVLERGTDDFYIPTICHRLGIPVAREFHFAKAAVYERSKLMGLFERIKYLFDYSRIFSAFDNYDYMLLLTKKDQIEGKYSNKTVVIPNVVQLRDVSIIPNYYSKSVISVGSMYDKRKGFDQLVEIWLDIIKLYPDWKLNIYGDGKERENIQRMIDDNSLSSSIILHGAVDDIDSAYLNSSFYVSASIAEGLPMVLIEAMNYGLPCIAYDCPTGPSDIITDGVDGSLVKLYDKVALKQAILNYIRDIEMVKEMGANAKMKAKKFSPENIIPLWISFFKSVNKL